MSQVLLKPYVFDAVEIGERFGPVDLLVDDRRVKRFVFALDDYNPWYFGDATPFGSRIAPSMLIADEIVNLYLTKYDHATAAGLHQKEDVWLRAPVPLGARLTLAGRYVDKYVKREKGYVVLEGEARDAQGGLLVRQRCVGLVQHLPGAADTRPGTAAAARRVTGHWPTDRPVAATASRHLDVGTPVGPFVKRLEQEHISIFSGVGKFWRNFHTDLEAARRAGYPTTLVPGMMQACALAEMLLRFYGPAWLTSGWISTSFIRLFPTGGPIVCKGVVAGRHDAPEGPRLELEIWSETHDGSMTAAGWASARVDG